MSEAWAIMATSASPKMPASTSRLLPTPVSSAGLPTTTSRTASWGKTLATAYSVRASDYAGVSTPLTWADVEEGVDPHDFTIRTALTRFHAVGDLWARLRMGPPAELRALLEKKHGVSS